MKLSLLACLMFISSLAFAEGNGGGHNGPDLSGNSIPVEMDREVEVRLIKSVELDCSKKLMAKLFTQAFGKPKGKLENIQEFKIDDIYGFETRGLILVNNIVIVNQSAWEHTTLVGKNVKFKIPRFAYSTEMVDTSYNEWGDLQADRVVVRNLVLENTHEGPISLINLNTKRDVSLKLDFREYQECLLNGIQQ